MAALMKSSLGCGTRLAYSQNISFTNALIPCRFIGGYTDWRMLRDAKRRFMIQEYGKLRLQVNAIRKNDILPRQIRELADVEIASLPLNTAPVRTHGRCMVTSRPRGKIPGWRLSRIFWRHLADYNYLSGIQRGMW